MRAYFTIRRAVYLFSPLKGLDNRLHHQFTLTLLLAYKRSKYREEFLKPEKRLPMRDSIPDDKRRYLLHSLVTRNSTQVYRLYSSKSWIYAVMSSLGERSPLHKRGHILFYRAREIQKLKTYPGTAIFLEDTFARFAFSNILFTQLEQSRFDQPSQFTYIKSLGRWSGFLKGNSLYIPILGNVVNRIPHSIRFQEFELPTWFYWWAMECKKTGTRVQDRHIESLHPNTSGIASDYTVCTNPIYSTIFEKLYYHEGPIPYQYETKEDLSAHRFLYKKECPRDRDDCFTTDSSSSSTTV